MNQRTYRELVVHLAKHITLSPQVSFEYLARESKSNRRVRNVFVFYALTDERYMEQFIQLERNDRFYLNLKNELGRTLQRLEKDSDPDVKQFGRYYLNQYFQEASVHSQILQVNKELYWNNYDVSAEMAKLMQTLVYRYKRKQEDTPEFRVKLTERKKQVKIYI
ncbi:TPA: hypothetical protein QCX17_002248 [Bacillus cereus]|nr:hypothetical protein [Bacillus cereus]